MNGVRGSPGAFRPALEPGSPAHRYALKRQRWARAYADWLADGRPDFLVLEPTPESAAGPTATVSIEGEAA